MSPSYPEIADDYARIERVAVSRGDRRSSRRSPPASKLFETAAEETTAAGRHARSPASTAFLLHDTQGFPLDLTLEMAAEAGLTVDTDELRPVDAGADAAGRGPTPRPARVA